jgi:hypothetical protein
MEGVGWWMRWGNCGGGGVCAIIPETTRKIGLSGDVRRGDGEEKGKSRLNRFFTDTVKNCEK